MSTMIQQKINPPVAQPTSMITPEQSTAQAIDSNGGAEKADFRSLILNSMDEVKKEREAKANGDLSGAKTQEEFLEKLADQTKEKKEAKNTLDKDDFMKLFVAQLQHQDPLNPDDGAEMASKLAQFNSLEQMMNVNKNLEKMASNQNTSQNLQLVNYIGNEVTIAGGRLNLKEGTHNSVEYFVKAPSTQTHMEVRDTSGTVVFENDLGSVTMGNHQFKWDGKAKDGRVLSDGTYTFSISARNIDGQDIPVEIKTKAIVTGVDITDKGGAVYTNYGKVKFDEIEAVGKPGFKEAVIDTNKVKALQNQKAGELNKPKAPTPAAPTNPPTNPNMANAVPNSTPAPTMPTVEQLDKMKAEGTLNLEQLHKETPTAPSPQEPPSQSAT